MRRSNSNGNSRSTARAAATAKVTAVQGPEPKHEQRQQQRQCPGVLVAMAEVVAVCLACAGGVDLRTLWEEPTERFVVQRGCVSGVLAGFCGQESAAGSSRVAGAVCGGSSQFARGAAVRGTIRCN